MQSNETRLERLKALVDVLPLQPGVYIYYDVNDVVIYVGKAKKLRNRVSQYFFNKTQTAKTQLLVSRIHNIKHIVVNSEEDALLLENNLIKKYKPRFNILLKDDKTYPWIVIRNERFPRVQITRNLVHDGSLYYGPYTFSSHIKSLFETFSTLFSLRTCNYDLKPDLIQKGYFKCCLKYHLGNCSGPCIGSISEEEYSQSIDNIRRILNGHTSVVVKDMKAKMLAASEELNFELAAIYKNRIDKLSEYQARSVVSSSSNFNADAFAIYDDENTNETYVNFIRVVEGCILQSFTLEFKSNMSDSREEILSHAIVEVRDTLKVLSRTIFVPFLPDVEFANISFVVPQTGDKKKLLELCEKNARMYALEKLKHHTFLRGRNSHIDLLASVQNKLQLPTIPRHIEIFDNSNIQGEYPVAACVVYKDGKPSKKDYRLFNIKTVEGPDDYASMYEVVNRRYARLIAEQQPLPDLIVADGGAGQMESIRQATEEALGLHIPILGLAKNDKHSTNELLIGFPPKHIEIRRTDDIFRFFAGMQEEVHRSAITFHRKKRSKSIATSELDQIKSIGPQTKEKLLQHFGSVKKIATTGLNDLEQIVGKAKAKAIVDYFSSKIRTS